MAYVIHEDEEKQGAEYGPLRDTCVKANRGGNSATNCNTLSTTRDKAPEPAKSRPLDTIMLQLEQKASVPHTIKSLLNIKENHSSILASI